MTRTSSPYFLVASLALGAAACKVQPAAEVQSVVGLQAGLDSQIRNGSEAPTFLALADWFQQFRVENSAAPLKKDPAKPYAVTMKEAGVKKRVDAALLAQLMTVVDQERARLGEFEQALAKNDDAKLLALLKLESKDMLDIAEALLYKYGARAGELKTANKFALLLAQRAGNDFIDRYAEKFLVDALKGRRGVKDVASALPQEAENYTRALDKLYVGSAAAKAKLAANIAENRKNLDALKRGLTGTGAPQYQVTGQVASMLQLAQVASHSSDYPVKQSAAPAKPKTAGAAPSTTPPASTVPATTGAGASAPSATTVPAATGGGFLSGAIGAALAAAQESTTGSKPRFNFKGQGTGANGAGGAIGGDGGAGGPDSTAPSVVDPTPRITEPMTEPMTEPTTEPTPSSTTVPGPGDPAPGEPDTGYDSSLDGNNYDPTEPEKEGTLLTDAGGARPAPVFDLSSTDKGLALADAAPGANLGENVVGCDELRNTPSAFIRCMRYSPALNTQGGAHGAGAGLALAGSGSGAPAPVPVNELLLPEKLHSAMQNQGQEGACTAFGFTHSLICGVKKKNPAFESAARNFWAKYNEPTMPTAARTALANTFASDDGSYEVKVTKISDLTSIESMEAALKDGDCLWVASGVNKGWFGAGGAKGSEILTCGGDPGAGHSYSIQGFQRVNENGNGGGYFLIKNSWGETWGTGGYARLPYACVKNPQGPFGFEAHRLSFECTKGCN